MPVSPPKPTIRHILLSYRKKLSSQYKKQASQQILSHLLKWDRFQKTRVLHTFLSRTDEVQTTPIIEHCWDQGKMVVVPFLHSHEKQLSHSILLDMEHVMVGKWKIPEPHPTQRQSIDLAKIDLVLVPGVGFDKEGGRIGYGKGYYDRFLEQLNRILSDRNASRAFLLGVGFQCQVVETLPQETHDISLDNVLTEEGFVKTL